MYTFTYQITLLHTLFCLFLKTWKSFSGSLKHNTINEQKKHVRTLVYKIWHALKVELWMFINKKQKCFCYQTSAFLDERFLLLVNKKGHERIIYSPICNLIYDN